jgi:hypothetical protein
MGSLWNIHTSTCVIEISCVGTCCKVHYQAFFWVSIDLIIDLLELIINPFDNQTERWNPVQTESTESVHLTTTSFFLFSYQPPTHRSLLALLVCVIIIGEDSCHHKSVIWYSFLPSMCFPVSGPCSFFLKSSCCFPAEVKTHPIPTPDPDNHGTVFTS